MKPPWYLHTKTKPLLTIYISTGVLKATLPAVNSVKVTTRTNKVAHAEDQKRRIIPTGILQ